ncbi:glycosyltransferase family 4 protein [Ramlibacter sp. AW1]|uniref:Glycosyltransferase family 4 protein n=1 Tax=Ramlibacter aurantiacus TaxID=2801330 RepID=A0A936ZE96_9BURK|nr:glycosyltransferase family 4 protein [Ramlibacter aurantiacus]MBL0419964.1 glycosyltransferase family 4 protein [Ramlibacter aurantiacus]
MAGERLSVLMTADTVGGVWTYALELAQGLGRRGWRVHLATMGAPLSPHQRAQAARVPRLKLHESSHKLEWMPDPWDDLERAARWLLALEAEIQPQVVHLNQYVFGALPFHAPTLLVAHSCVSSWWRAVRREDAPPAWDRYRDCVSRGLAGATLVAAPTRAMLNAVQRHYGTGADGLVLPNGRDPALFQPATKQGFVLAAGRLWDPAKNLAALEAVAPGLPWPVRVAGACTGPDGTVQAPTWVQALGQLPPFELARQMGRASIYAFPARYEPFGLSILEAALSGCALVLGDLDSLREIWGDAALYVPPDDHLALRDTLVRLIVDADLRAALAQAAYERAQHFDPERMTQATLSAYGRLPALKAKARRKEETPCA